MPKAKKSATAPKAEEKIWAAASYLWILSLVALAARKNNPYIRFHANQGVLLFAVSIISFLTGPFMFVINMILAIVAIVGLVKAYQGEKWELPLFGDMAVKLSGWIIKKVRL